MSFIRNLKNRFRYYGRKADIWFDSDQGSRFRFYLFGSSVAVYPIGVMILNGPLLNYSFKWRCPLDTNLPTHLQAIIDEQYKKWLERESRKEKNAFVKFSCQNEAGNFDTKSAGSLTIRFGAQLALPFYARFTCVEEAKEYCKKYMEPLKFHNGHVACVLWDSPKGEELLKTMVLSKQALSFLITRDLFANDGYNAFANKPICWATWTTFSSIFTAWFYAHFVKRKTLLSFLITYLTFIIIIIYGCKLWNNFYDYLNAFKVDKKSAQTSFEHSSGGREYYEKFLKRNRILRELFDKGHKIFTASGDELKAVTPYILRYDLLKDAGLIDEEIKPLTEGDDFD